MNIKRPEGTPLNASRRIIWCPFIPDDSEENVEEGSQTLALLHEDRVRAACSGELVPWRQREGADEGRS